MLHLQELAKQGQQVQTVKVVERLPAFISGACVLSATYHVEAKDDFYLIHLHTTGVLNSLCQRCMQEFDYPYDNQTIIAVCRSDERAEQLLEQYECIVASNWQVDLLDLIVDELHLYAPEFHPDIKDCDSEVIEILTGKNETY